MGRGLRPGLLETRRSQECWHGVRGWEWRYWSLRLRDVRPGPPVMLRSYSAGPTHTPGSLLFLQKMGCVGPNLPVLRLQGCMVHAASYCPGQADSGDKGDSGIGWGWALVLVGHSRAEACCASMRPS